MSYVRTKGIKGITNTISARRRKCPIPCIFVGSDADRAVLHCGCCDLLVVVQLFDDELSEGVVQVSFEDPGQQLFVKDFVAVVEDVGVGLPDPSHPGERGSVDGVEDEAAVRSLRLHLLHQGPESPEHRGVAHHLVLKPRQLSVCAGS